MDCLFECWSRAKKDRGEVVQISGTPGIEPALRPIVFSGEDGAFYNYLWSNRKTDFMNETERVNNRFRSFAQGYFAEEVEPFTCDKCDSRVACPHWIKALA
jgi:hypothetical protein